MTTDWNLFVYGSLGPPGSHDSLLRPWLSEVSPATAPGCLYEDDEGFPFLDMPHEAILAKGTGDLEEDLAAWNIVCGALRTLNRDDPRWHSAPDQEPSVVEGFLLTFQKWPGPVPLLDEWEEFQPPSCYVYQRVIACVCVGESCMNAHVPAWTYVRKPEVGSVPIGRRWIPRTFS